MQHEFEFISVKIEDIVVRSDAEEPEYQQGDLTVLASLSQEALDYLQVLRPLVVSRKSNRKTAYELVGGFGTFRVLRAAVGEHSQVRAIEVEPADALSVRALDLLVAPALEGAGASDTVVRRWVGVSEQSQRALERLGFPDMSRSAIAHLFGVSRPKVYRAINSGEGPSENGGEER